MLGAALYLGLVSIFALGVGTLIRSSAGGIAAALGVILVLPTLMPIPQEFPPGFEPPSVPLEPGVATLVVLAWAAVAIALGVIGLKRRDA